MKKKISYILSVILFLIFILGPILWCFLISITPEKDLFSSIIPNSFSFENYENLLSFNTRDGENFYNAMKNSVLTAGITIFLGMPISLITGYIFARSKEKKVLVFMKLLFFSMIIPIFTTVIPLYTLFSKYNMLNSIFFISLIYLSSFLPLISWITMNYFKEFPIEIEEMALIDGCNRFKVLLYIVLPNIYPIIFTGVLVIFLKAWSQYQLPLILASANNVKPLTILITEYTSKDMALYGQMAAAGILSTVPPIIFAICFRKYLISGLTKGSLN